MIEDRARDARLHELLTQYHRTRSNRIIIFVLYKKEAVRVEQYLAKRGWKVRVCRSPGRSLPQSCLQSLMAVALA